MPSQVPGPMTAYRIGQRVHPVFSGEGASLVGGRWNDPGHPVIYSADSLSTCILELRVHLNGVMPPPNLGWIQISIPSSVTVERVTAAELPGWLDLNPLVSKEYGNRWLQLRRTAVLVVPSVAASGLAENVLINPLHQDFRWIVASEEEPLELDKRLFT